MTNKGMSVLHCQDAFKIYMLYRKPLDDNASVPTEPGGWEAVTPHHIWVKLEVKPIPSNDMTLYHCLPADF